MFKHLLVPLDGSASAEATLPAAAYLARTLDAMVTLVHVMERDAPRAVHGERHLTAPDEAEAYLAAVAGRAFPAGSRVERHVHAAEVGDVARSIVEHSGELAPDLVIMCTHGRRGPKHWLFGSIAQQVIAGGATPVLIIQPEKKPRPDFACRLLMIPVDRIPEHEQALPLAAGLARACKAGLYLITVVPTLRTLSGEWAATGRFAPGATGAMLDMIRQEAEEHLAGYAAGFGQQALPVQAEVVRGDPARTIAKAARRVQADLIVLGTHGKTGLDAFWAGSVAARLAGLTEIPLLLVPLRPVAAPGA